jgi:5,5'-dehydrodivanillate O-demethylase oxygenase subunit
MYRDQSGQLRMVDEKYPHRSVSTRYGIVEDCGLRCAYHGWAFDKEGNCVEQPAEPPASQFKDRVSIGAYPVQEMGGLLWTYIGEAPVPELPRFDVYVMDGVRDAGYATIPCNWLQVMENSVDPYHVEFLHGYYFEYLGNKERFEAPKSFRRSTRPLRLRKGNLASSADCSKVKRRRRRLEDRPPADVPLPHARRWGQH